MRDQHDQPNDAIHSPTLKGSALDTIIVFCHLRWDFVYQRPQHLLTRLAEHFKVLVVEEPIFHEGASFLKSRQVAPNLTVFQPHTPVAAGGFHDDQIPLLQPLLAELVPAGEDPIAWCYTPMALPLLQSVHPRVVVYDCMDELSAFKNAPKQLLQRESALLNQADVVFTGGPSLYEAKRDRNPNTHCFPSSVDVAHFSKALERSAVHPSQGGIATPRLGFYGVIDERFDTGLLQALADAHPEWQLVMVGPVVKIDPALLPKNSNIHYMGQASYEELPQYLAAWDVCLLPFALNESTKFISPTKVLEYMAAELPIVSTAITDVVKPYGAIVSIAHSPQEFVKACEDALALTPERRAKMVDEMRAVVQATSWSATADQMRALLTARPAQERIEGAGAGTSAASVNPLRSNAAAQTYNCVIVGGGPTGLSAAYHLGKDAILLDKNATPGGWCRSIEDRGFTFDYAGHIMFSNDPYVLKLYDKLLGDNLHWQNREAWVYSKDVYTRYPFQGALYGLPPKVITECIVGAIEARYGAEKDKAAAPACDLAKPVEDCCADGGVELPAAGQGTAVAAAPAKPGNFEEFIYKVWGAGIAKHFAIPYNKKLWTVPLTDMETSWLGGRVPLPDLAEIIEGALEPVGKPMGPNARFGYPLKGGFQALVTGFLPFIEGRVEHNAEVIQVLPSEKTVALADGRRIRYEHLISTMPLPELVKMIGQEAPEEVRMAAKGLNHISIRCVNLGINRANITDKHWIYYPEETIFHRIFVQGNASPHCNPPGGFGLTCEISYSPWKPLPLDGDALIARCIADCIAVGIIDASDEVIVANQVDMPYAYVVYDHARAANVATVKDWLAKHDIVLSGRYSEWEYYNSDHAFIAGKKAAETVLAAGGAGNRSAAAE
ncbi:MAG TPA: NAD(P)-binding protein [Telluria sp.]|jgi:protoporphyrinogen oxidase/glycosyltransferase involved in cell wall biosynthesis